MSRMTRRSFFAALRGRGPGARPHRAERPATRSFDLDGFYRQRELLGLAGQKPPPAPITAAVDVPTTAVGSPDVEKP